MQPEQVTVAMQPSSFVSFRGLCKPQRTFKPLILEDAVMRPIEMAPGRGGFVDGYPTQFGHSGFSFCQIQAASISLVGFSNPGMSFKQ